MPEVHSPQRTTVRIRSEIGVHREALRGIVEALDPDEVLASQAPALWVEFDRIERLAAAAKILLARRVDDSRVWEREGHRSVVDYLAQKSGSSKAVSRGVLATSKKVRKLAATSAALRRGELSASQAESVADAASHNRDAEEHLLETAATSSLGELRDECTRRKAAADPHPDETYKRIHRTASSGSAATQKAAGTSPPAAHPTTELSSIPPWVRSSTRSSPPRGRRVAASGASSTPSTR